ncbi:Iron-sulfur cluster assembly ATPase protein SufC [hydrothermal vent metagenome]|uniref:Iron-sulfur cluster assembly ATPase protein SufC n=1 Tax=hydrothermal vent metagenome TaxID=652676 RepID=A0A3B1CTM0_9ZZZZ
MALLEIKGLTFEVGDKRIIDNLNLSIEAREVHALVGTNGTGKSTLACLIMGCNGYKPSSGEIILEGRCIDNLEIHERARLGIAMACQEPVRFEGITVRDYITIKNRGADPAHYLEMVGLHPELYLDRMVDKSLSGGERKRIELASVLALNPKLAILDEPDSGIDMLSTADIINVINAFKENGASVLLITHREEIAMIADRASQLCGGRIVCSGEPEMVAEYYKSRRCLVCNGRVCLE